MCQHFRSVDIMKGELPRRPPIAGDPCIGTSHGCTILLWTQETFLHDNKYPARQSRYRAREIFSPIHSICHVGDRCDFTLTVPGSIAPANWSKALGHGRQDELRPGRDILPLPLPLRARVLPGPALILTTWGSRLGTQHSPIVRASRADGSRLRRSHLARCVGLGRISWQMRFPGPPAIFPGNPAADSLYTHRSALVRPGRS